MTLATLDALSTAPERCRAQAWAGSTLIHIFCVSLAIFLMTDFLLPAQPEPLKLDIALIQPSPQKVHKQSEPQDRPKPTPMTQKIESEKVITPTTVQPTMVKRESVEEPLASPIIETRELHHSEPLHQSLAQIQQPSKVPTPLQRNVAVQHHTVQTPSPEQTPEHVQQKQILASTPVQEKAVLTNPEVILDFSHKIHAQPIQAKPPTEQITQAKWSTPTEHTIQTKSIEQTQPMEQLESIEQKKVIEHREHRPAQRKESPTRSSPKPVIETPHEVALAHHAPVQTAPLSERIMETVPLESLPKSVPVSRSESPMTHPPVLTRKLDIESTEPVVEKPEIVKARPVSQIHQRTAAVERSLRAFPQTRADYGWLAQAIWNQIEKYKRYPTKARQKGWEGKVVLEAVIRRDGTILNLRVAETSGHEILDQNAMEVLWKVSPLVLDYSLDRPHITILVPLTYQLDG